MTLFEQAKARYEALGVDVEAAMDKLAQVPVSRATTCVASTEIPARP